LAFGDIARRVELDLLYRETPSTFTQAMRNGSHLLCEDFFNLILRFKDELDNIIVEDRDELLSW
jgi:hypothetical protein